ncbi:hypothetical protein LguiB_005825 [Lonicera macranthoides]
MDMIQGWSDAVSFATDLSGFVLQNQGDGVYGMWSCCLSHQLEDLIEPEGGIDLSLPFSDVCLGYYPYASDFIAIEEKVRVVQEDFVPIEAETEGGLLNQEPSSSVEEWTAVEINLKDIEELPENSNCPGLVKLVLERSYDLMEIPSSFFKSMPMFQVLDLSNMSIKTLP